MVKSSMQKAILLCLALFLSVYFTAVSYTHLDLFLAEIENVVVAKTLFDETGAIDLRKANLEMCIRDRECAGWSQL